MKLSEIRQLLTARNLQLTKSLGQNFLHDGNQLRRIVELAELKRDDRVLEIGPGLGPLTELLLQRSGEVLALEKDARLVEVLRERFAPARDCEAGGARLHLVHADALDFLARERRDWRGWKLVANLPYSVASPILVELAAEGRGPSRMVATLQLEVAKRLMAGPTADDYGLLTLLVQLDYQPLDWFKIPPGCFFPEPDVDSACVCLQRREPALLEPELRAVFVRLVKLSFSQRRKMMLKRLKTHWPLDRLQAAFAAVPLSPLARAESVSLEQFVKLARCLGPLQPAAHERRMV